VPEDHHKSILFQVEVIAAPQAAFFSYLTQGDALLQF
jgi:hypothetical protein